MMEDLWLKNVQPNVGFVEDLLLYTIKAQILRRSDVYRIKFPMDQHELFHKLKKTCNYKRNGDRAPLSFLMSYIFDGKESKMSYIMQDFLQVRVNDVVRGRAGIVNKTKSAIV